jgi:hypothetical protein
MNTEIVTFYANHPTDFRPQLREELLKFYPKVTNVSIAIAPEHGGFYEFVMIAVIHYTD